MDCSSSSYNICTLLEPSEAIQSVCYSLHGTLYREAVTRAICYYYNPPCGNITHFAPPNALCQDVCFYLAFDLCSEEWELALDFVGGMEHEIDVLRASFLNCNQPGAPLGTLSHCCSDAGIDIMDITPGEIVVERKATKHWTMDSNPATRVLS